MSDTSKKPSVEFFYEKNPLYRTVFTDGLFGGLTPTGSINLSFYATRNAIPKSVKHELNENGVLNPKGVKSEDSKSGIVREIEVGVYMDRKTANEMYQFLKKILEPNEK